MGQWFAQLTYTEYMNGVDGQTTMHANPYARLSVGSQDITAVESAFWRVVFVPAPVRE